MTEESAPGRKHRFLDKSKWQKKFKGEDSPASATKSDFTLSEDVNDFLKPSTEKYSGAGTRPIQQPAVDVDRAQRWPGAAGVQDVQSVNQYSAPQPFPIAATRKQKRRKDLTVRFTNEVPETIGHGGDETEVPTIEISRMRDRGREPRRSQSHRQPAMFSRDQVRSPPRNQQIEAGGIERSRTHHGRTQAYNQLSDAGIFAERSPQRQPKPFKLDQDAGPRPGLLKRAPTGFSNYDEEDHSPIDDSPVEGANPFSDKTAAETPVRPAPSQQDQGSPEQSNPELSKFLQSSRAQLRTPSFKEQRQEHDEEGRSFQRAYRLSRAAPPGEEEDYLAKASRASLQSMQSMQSEQPPRPSMDSVAHESVGGRSRQGSLTVGPEPHRPGSSSGNQRMLHSAAPRAMPARPAARSSGSSGSGMSPQDYIERFRSGSGSAPSKVVAMRESPSHNNGFVDSPTAYRPPDDYSAAQQLAPRNGLINQLKQNAPTIIESPSSPRTEMPPPTSYNIAKITPSPSASRETSPSYFDPGGSTSSANQQLSSSVGSHTGRLSPGMQSAPSPSLGSDPNKAAAFDDFASRVTQMRGVFRLIAEKEGSGRNPTPQQWLRATIWWFHQGRSGIEATARGRARPSAEIGLVQAHVDIAKAWWILAEVLEQPEVNTQLPSQVLPLTHHFEMLSLWMAKNHVLPPHQSLIQGQDTGIWIQYPNFPPDIAYLLGNTAPNMQATDLIPFGDTSTKFFYNRMFINVTANTDDPATDRVNIPCVLSIVRDSGQYLTTLYIASQNDLVNIVLSQEHDKNNPLGPTWSDVSWKAKASGMYIKLPRGFTLNISLSESDFRTLWNITEYTRKMSKAFRHAETERLIYQAPIAEAQYADTTNPSAFPREKVRGCKICIFENIEEVVQGAFSRVMHFGYRVVLATPPSNKSLSAVHLDFGKSIPFLYDIPDAPPGSDAPALQLHGGASGQRKRMLLVFRDRSDWSALLDILHGVKLSDAEGSQAKLPLRDMSLTQATSNSPNLLKDVRWQGIAIINTNEKDALTVLSESLRCVIQHAGGAFVDRMNFGPGELLIRLPADSTPSIQILRPAQNDMTVTIDARSVSRTVSEQLTTLASTIGSHATIRSYTFSSLPELRRFERAITGCEIHFDSPVSLFSITRRAKFVTVHKKLEATKVRIQIVSQDGTYQILAFFEDFAPADAIVFEVKGSDEFEKAKMDKLGPKFGVRLVQAKFSLPVKKEDGAANGGPGGWPGGGEEEGVGIEDERIRRRFVNVEGLEYAHEHDDIVVGFDEEHDYDRFCEALPGQVTSGRAFTLMRRI